VSAGTSRSEAVYRILLRAYPPEFRERYEEEIVEAFRDRRTEASSRRGAVGLASLWLSTVPDVLWHGLVERRSERRRMRSSGSVEVLRAAVRTLARAPLVTGVVVATLAVGIGTDVALFSLVRGVLLRPLPYSEPEELFRVWETNPSVDDELLGPSPLNFSDWQRLAEGVESMAAWYLTSGTYRTESWVEEIRSAQVTADFFRVLGVEPALGRDFRPEEVVRYGPVMLSHRLWLRRFGGDPAVVGSTIVSSGNSYEIVGVMPADFSFPDESVEAWIAWDLPAVYTQQPESRTWRFLGGIVRLADGTSRQQAERSLQGVASTLAESYPIMNGGWSVRLSGLHDETVGAVRGTLWMAFAAVSMVLLVACANVANLLLARAPARLASLRVRRALGASRARVARELAVENLLMAGAGCALGLVVGRALLTGLVAIDVGRIPRLTEVRLDTGVFAFAVGVAALTSIVFGLAPVLAAVRDSAPEALSGRRTIGARGHRRLREIFVGSQVAVAVVLLAAAGLFGRTLVALTRVDPGIDPERVATFRVSLDPPDGSEGATVDYYRTLLERLESIPGVTRAAAAQTLPMNPVGNDFRRPYRPVGSGLESARAPTVQMRIVTPGYVDAIGMRVLAGTTLPPDAGLGEPLVAMVNETLARALWPDGGAVGSSLELDFREGWQPYRVVGVLGDVKHYGVRAAAAPEIFLSHRQVPYLAMSVVARVLGDPAAMTDELAAAVLSHVPSQPAHSFVSLEELVATSTAEERFLTVLLAVLAGVGLALSSTGVYAVIAFAVSQSRGDIGVRMALGAKPRRVFASVLGRALTVAGAGALAGLVGTLILARWVEGLLFGVDARDPLVHLATVAAMLLVATVAAAVPANRAASTPPSETLRSG